ncbi:MAG: L,D-transpeptidase [Pseudomonadota bacterium]
MVFFLCGFTEPTPERGVWVLVDTQELVLTVMNGTKPVEQFRNIAIGRGGVSYEKRRGDDRTPLGSFRIGWVNQNSSYRLFFGFNYPSLDIAKRGLISGIIDVDTFNLLKQASENDQIPPQNTPLGGQIGIHGIGSGDPRIHEAMNWTHGCVALTNVQVERLARWVTKGTLIIIR